LFTFLILYQFLSLSCLFPVGFYRFSAFFLLFLSLFGFFPAGFYRFPAFFPAGFCRSPAFFLQVSVAFQSVFNRFPVNPHSLSILLPAPEKRLRQ